MRKSTIATAVLVGLFASATVSAATVNMRHEYQPSYKGNNAKHKDRISISHRLKNGVGFEVEAKWANNKNDDAFGDYTGSGQQANISYLYKIGKSGFSLKPQYKWESGSTKLSHQFNLTLGYKINKAWAVSWRHRYNYERQSSTVDKPNNHYNRWTFEAGYKGFEDWKLGASFDYTWNSANKGNAWEDKKAWFSEFNTKATYTGFEGNWSPFIEIGLAPDKDKDANNKYDNAWGVGSPKAAKDIWRPRFRIGMKYKF
ncbi:oligogalacturonate-specific porin KdgM family protein [Agarivorans sp. QJM3NY_33]|uniref:oligogalacturonate-specific porin KdgM family protein n=1 Tax=Agarivorans sp. QJM3NY_33 TaxID=3421432 RepID=UPI003D7EEA85